MKRGILAFAIILALMSNTLIATAEETTENNKTINLPSIGNNLDKEISLPDGAQSKVRTLLGVRKSQILTTSLLIIMICIWIIAFLFLASLFGLISFFQSWMRWVVAACVTLIIAITGTIENIALSLLALGKNIAFFEKWPAGALLFIIILIFIGGYILNKITKQIKRYEEKTRAEVVGWKRGLREKKEKIKEEIAGE